jgi:LmbE family N-acetylglucosaminyl deacetylase
MNAIALVAHPDDCVIFASAYMDAHPEYKWTIVYLTCWRLHKRGREMARYWKRRGVKTHFLGFKDHGRDLGLNGLYTWDKNDAIRALRRATIGYELILTHGEQGEYGHPHHRVVHESTKAFGHKKVFFSIDNTDLMLPMNVGMSELPRHRESIKIHAPDGVAYYKEETQ